MKFPKSVIVVGKRYAITYTENTDETDIDKRKALWGQVDYHTRTIRVYVGKDKRKRQQADILETLLHEIIHCVLTDNAMMKAAIKDEKEESFVDNMGCALADTLVRNGFIRLE